MFGWLRYDPDKFYRMRYRDVVLMYDGFWDKTRYEQVVMRRFIHVLHSSLVPKPLRPQDILPIEGTEEKKLTREYLKARGMAVEKRLRMMQAIEDEKRKN